MDRITKSLFDEFRGQYQVTGIPEADAFEQFASYIVVSAHYPESFSIEDLVVGAGADLGIDAIAILVNGVLVTEPEEVAELSEAASYLDATFIFVQATTSSAFEAAKLGQFSFGVCDFLSVTPGLPRNQRIAHYAEVTQELFDRSRLFRGNPQCVLYYVTTGRWTDDPHLVAMVQAAKADIEETGLFRKVEVECVDAEGLQNRYRAAQNAVSVELLFTNNISLPEIPGVEQAYLGLLPASQFLRLVENASGEMMGSVFHDNVRDWQEWNPVNREIQATLSAEVGRVRFPLLNNGVTVVAQAIRPTGDKFYIEDYQVVNGCQTSYVLHECKALLENIDSVMVPVRLIATRDEEIKNAVVKATNRQTGVTEDQLLARSDFPKKLEAFFPTFNGPRRLYYERRSRQYNRIDGIEKVRVITMTTLVRAFASVFLDAPHRTTRNYRALLQQIGTGIFHKDHLLEPYYLAAYMHYRLEFLFRNQTLSALLKPARYHILLGGRLHASNTAVPSLRSRDGQRYCQQLMETMWDDNQSRALFEQSAETVTRVAAGNLHRDNIRTEQFTKELLAQFGR